MEIVVLHLSFVAQCDSGGQASMVDAVVGAHDVASETIGAALTWWVASDNRDAWSARSETPREWRILVLHGVSSRA